MLWSVQRCAASVLLQLRYCLGREGFFSCRMIQALSSIRCRVFLALYTESQSFGSVSQYSETTIVTTVKTTLWLQDCFYQVTGYQNVSLSKRLLA